MGFWDLKSLKLEEFRPGIHSKAEFGTNLIMAFMEIASGKEDSGHDHPYDQCGIVLEGHIEMFIGDERKTLNPMESYFIPAGLRHGFKVGEAAAKILDISLKP